MGAFYQAHKSVFAAAQSNAGARQRRRSGNFVFWVPAVFVWRQISLLAVQTVSEGITVFRPWSWLELPVRNHPKQAFLQNVPLPRHLKG
jgi:hypothetical protein